jgi:predicted DNA-binding transcriptional regulator YafY
MKPIHHLQEVVEEYADGSLSVRMPLYLNYELRSVLLGYGGDVEVIGPEALRVQYRQELERMLALHGQ